MGIIDHFIASGADEVSETSIIEAEKGIMQKFIGLYS
jgi:hypothetical protein